VIRSIRGGILIDVHVIPRARKNEIGGTRGDALLVRLNAPPVDGAANAALIELLASTLQVPAQLISIVAGGTSRRKRVEVLGLDIGTAESRLHHEGDTT
jgi:uncharacterized protein (TIGR00251 family)